MNMVIMVMPMGRAKGIRWDGRYRRRGGRD